MIEDGTRVCLGYPGIVVQDNVDSIPDFVLVEWDNGDYSKADKTNLTNLDELPRRDYTMVEGTLWLTLKGFSIWVRHTPLGVAVDVYPVGKEGQDPLATCTVYDKVEAYA